MTHLPSISSYGQYSSNNYGVNTLVVSTAAIDLYYSYKTIVAYRTIKDGLIVCENVWGTTTGKHLNWINPVHNTRLSYDTFQGKLATTLKELRL